MPFKARPVRKDVGQILVACLGFAISSSQVYAGGYDVGERDWDFLFEANEGGVEAQTRYIVPQRKLKDVTFAPPIPVPSVVTSEVDETESFSVQRFSAVVPLGDRFSCMGSYRQPWEGHANYGTTWVAAGSAVEQHFSSEDIGVTCAVSFELQKGELHLLAGYSHQEIRYQLTQQIGQFPFFSTISTDVSDSSHGWRAGIAYEIEEYALRASLIYNSAIDYEMNGTVTNSIPLFPALVIPVRGDITMPQSVEFKIQSGVAPGWLAFGAVKWTDWSVLEAMYLCPTTTPVCTQAGAISALVLDWKDTWTLTAGLAHQFSEQFSLAGNVTWDQGASQGFTSQTDTWTFGLTGILSANEHVQLKLGGTVGMLTGGSLDTRTLPGGAFNPLGYTATFDDDLVYSLSANLSVKF